MSLPLVLLSPLVAQALAADASCSSGVHSRLLPLSTYSPAVNFCSSKFPAAECLVSGHNEFKREAAPSPDCPLATLYTDLTSLPECDIEAACACIQALAPCSTSTRVKAKQARLFKRAPASGPGPDGDGVDHSGPGPDGTGGRGGPGPDGTGGRGGPGPGPSSGPPRHPNATVTITITVAPTPSINATGLIPPLPTGTAPIPALPPLAKRTPASGPGPDGDGVDHSGPGPDGTGGRGGPGPDGTGGRGGPGPGSSSGPPNPTTTVTVTVLPTPSGGLPPVGTGTAPGTAPIPLPTGFFLANAVPRAALPPAPPPQARRRWWWF